MSAAPASAKTALIVESNALYRDLLHEMLLELGWTVETAWNGIIGREKARRHEFDLVLCGLTLPQRDEADTIASIRAQQARARIVALPAAMALADDPRLIAAYDSGADGVLYKPFGIYDLGKAIDATPQARASAGVAPSRVTVPVLEWAYP